MILYFTKFFSYLTPNSEPMETLPEKTPGLEMTIDLVNEQDQVIGNTKRKNVLKRGENFRTVHVFVFNKRKELLLQKTSSKHPRSPLKWGSSVAGYLFAGEDYYSGAKRRLNQELGISDNKLTKICKIPMKDNLSLKFITLFTCEIDDVVYPDQNLIDKVDFIPLEEIKKLIKTSPYKFTGTFIYLFEHFLNRTEHVQV